MMAKAPKEVQELARSGNQLASYWGKMLIESKKSKPRPGTCPYVVQVVEDLPGASVARLVGTRLTINAELDHSSKNDLYISPTRIIPAATLRAL